MKDLVCASGVDLIMDYLEGALSPEVTADIEAHVASCGRCAAFIASYQATPRIVREASAFELPPDLEESLMAFLRRRRGQKPGP